MDVTLDDKYTRFILYKFCLWMGLLQMNQQILDKIKIVAMAGLIITMGALAVAIWKYGIIIQQDPCSLCNCAINLMKGGIG